FCDAAANAQRGFVLGWLAGSLRALPAKQLNNRRTHSADNFFLSSVWMSGNGIAANAAGQLYFTTGNSDPSGTSYNPKINLSESIVRMAPDLSAVESFFTPSDSSYGVQILDHDDSDFGSGGVLLLPPQPGATVALAVAAGKAGQMYLLDADDLGGYSSNGQNR